MTLFFSLIPHLHYVIVAFVVGLLPSSAALPSPSRLLLQSYIFYSLIEFQWYLPIHPPAHSSPLFWWSSDLTLGLMAPPLWWSTVLQLLHVTSLVSVIRIVAKKYIKSVVTSKSSMLFFYIGGRDKNNVSEDNHLYVWCYALHQS